MDFPKKLTVKLQQRINDNSLRSLTAAAGHVDFSSNDYLGLSRSQPIFDAAHQLLSDRQITANGATGSRLLTGNSALYSECEDFIAKFHVAESALLFNSGYDANVGFFSSVPQRGDVILYDALSHASIRDGIQLSQAKAYKFAHNDLEQLESLIERHSAADTVVYVVTESVFSMDGDSPNLHQLADICQKHHCRLVVDEAHALGVIGEGRGFVQDLNLHDSVFARIITFGKGLGCHGAAIVGSDELKSYLVNFARSFIFTTGLPPHSVATILCAYQQLQSATSEIQKLRDVIAFFNSEKAQLGLKPLFVRSKSAIQSAIIPGNENVKRIARNLQQSGFDIRPILSPTVAEGQERLRICLHSYNTENEISAVLQILTAAF